MLKLWRYYLSYGGAIILAVAFLFVQVNMDLALPDYLSRIVNVGLQQGGIESPVPEKLSQQTMDSLQSGLNRVEKEKLESLYTPSEDKNGVFILKDNGEKLLEEDEKFRETFLRSFMVSTMGVGVSDPAMADQMRIQAVAREYDKLEIDRQELQSTYILRTGGIMLLITLISALATIIVGYIAARVSAGVARNLRFDLFSKIESFSNAEFDHFSTASLITRNTNDITQVQRVTFMLIRMVLFAPIMGIGGVIRAMAKAPSMAWVIGLAVLLLLCLMSVVMSIALPKFKAIQKLVDRVNKVAREQLTGLLVVRAFNRQDFEEERFDEANVDLTRINLFVTRVMVLLMPVIMLVMNVLSLAIIWVGAEQIAASAMQVGDMMAFLQYAMQIVMSFLMLSMAFIFIPRASVSAERINEVLNTEGSITNPANAQALPDKPKGLVEFRNVSFSYPGAEEMALENISFEARPGETTAIIGSTGSGKSSLINLIPRFYDIREGEILLDGLNVQELNIKDLRSIVGYVPQKSILFSGTIESNLAYGTENPDDRKIMKAAAISQSMDFINEREEKFDSPISQSGANVSGGQKQRLSIARALINNFPVLIFDDSFSALDYRTDKDLRSELEKEFSETTRIIVAQRVSTIMQSEQILVLDDGKLVGQGRHKELMETCETYREIVLSQLSLEEV